MSTRSGKRIHTSFHENLLKLDVEHVVQSERKTRSRRFKKDADELSASVVKTKKRTNYVSYPTDDEVGTDRVDTKGEEAKPTRLLRKNALKEQNNVTSATESTGPLIESLKPLVRTTRRMRKFEDAESAQENHVEEILGGGTISKKEKKKKKSIPEEVGEEIIIKKKSKKKVKKSKRSGSMIIEDILPENDEKHTLNKSNMSVDSFHSAAGSPHKNTAENKASIVSPVKNFETVTTLKCSNEVHKSEGRQTRSFTRISRIDKQSTPESVVKVSRKRKSSFKDLDEKVNGNQTMNKNAELNEIDITLTNTSKKRKSNIRDTFSVENDKSIDGKIKDSTFDLEDLERRESIVKAEVNTTYDKSETTKSDSTFNKELLLDKNTTYEKNESSFAETRKSAIINTTYEKDFDNDKKLDTEVLKSPIINVTYDKNVISAIILSESADSNTNSAQKVQEQSTELNSTYKTEKSDSTFDKDKKLDTTFDKNSKSSLISSDTSNITLDKSNVSRISITSDDSKDNIINTTPVLIESSLDESQITTSKLSLKTDDIQLSPPKLKSPSETKEISPKTPITPLKREGTFTKDASDIPEIINSPRTPLRKMSLPSPGCTPFPSKSASKSSMINVTHSIEKSRRSSLMEPLPRATRVMFCSPVNNPVAVAQQRKKVIKSNLKGSNKSFVLEDAEAAPRTAPRKRSYTHSDVEEARVKRHRLENGAHTSSGRVSRTRTTSATVKLTDPGTPSKRSTSVTTPKKSESKISRTKLPNFAALHQREFAKMESLDECQERKARRAKQLLTPTGAVTVLERSPTEPTETNKTDETKKSPLTTEDSKYHSEKRPKDAKKPDTPIKSLPTLKSLNPGYTRFGFKLNYDVNPFNITNKRDTNTSQSFSSKKNIMKKNLTRPLKEIRGLKRQVTLPSISGAASARDLAKQTVMREKSFTDKRNKTRNENRTVIKGVRTNRRFELQMRMRNIE